MISNFHIHDLEQIPYSGRDIFAGAKFLRLLVCSRQTRYMQIDAISPCMYLHLNYFELRATCSWDLVNVPAAVNRRSFTCTERSHVVQAFVMTSLFLHPLKFSWFLFSL